MTLPAGVAGDQVLTVYGNQTGDGTPEAYIKLPGVKVDSTVTAADQTATYGSAGSLTATVSGATDPGGDVTFSEGGTTLGTADVAPTARPRWRCPRSPSAPGRTRSRRPTAAATR